MSDGCPRTPRTPLDQRLTVNGRLDGRSHLAEVEIELLALEIESEVDLRALLHSREVPSWIVDQRLDQIERRRSQHVRRGVFEHGGAFSLLSQSEPLDARSTPPGGGDRRSATTFDGEKETMRYVPVPSASDLPNSSPSDWRPRSL